MKDKTKIFYLKLFLKRGDLVFVARQKKVSTNYVSKILNNIEKSKRISTALYKKAKENVKTEKGTIYIQAWNKLEMGKIS